MDKKIQSKPFCFGNKNESEWPKQFGTGEKGTWYYDKTGNPQDTPVHVHEKYGEAPQVIFDSMPKTYHEGLCREIESRKEWQLADKITGCISFGSKEQAKIRRDEASEAKRKKEELRKASLEALTEYKQNPTQVKERVAKQTEKQLAVLEKSGINLDKIKTEGVKV